MKLYKCIFLLIAVLGLAFVIITDCIQQNYRHELEGEKRRLLVEYEVFVELMDQQIESGDISFQEIDIVRRNSCRSIKKCIDILSNMKVDDESLMNQFMELDDKFDQLWKVVKYSYYIQGDEQTVTKTELLELGKELERNVRVVTT